MYVPKYVSKFAARYGAETEAYVQLANRTLASREKPLKGICHSFLFLLFLQDIFGNLNDAMLNHRASTADTLAAVDIKVCFVRVKRGVVTDKVYRS